MSQEVRVRFAPSPTGGLHIGGVRTALFNYLFARNQGGKMILRIEDTDQNRFVAGAETYIKNALDWCGIEIDEGPDQGGPFGPYRQSERKDIYQKYALQLVQEDKAYYAFDTDEEINALRERLKAAKVANPTYNAITRSNMKNSLTLSADEVQTRIAAGEPYVIRLKVPKKEEIRFNDMIRGWIMVHSSTIDDKVILKSDGMPTYHLANIVDDHLMEITHIIRGEEWLPSAPLHVLLYQYLGWEEVMPRFAHLPLILKPTGSGKLSKRDAQKGGFPIFPLSWKEAEEESTGFREEGYLSSALVNFLALLGWNPGTEQEIFNMEALIKGFSLARVGKAGTKFDIEKAQWFNQQYLKMMTDEEIADIITPDLKKSAPDFSQPTAKLVHLMKDRVTFPHEIVSKTTYLFNSPQTFDEKTVKKKWTQESVRVLLDFKSALEGLHDFTSEPIKELFQQVIEKNEVGFGRVMPAVRLAITGLGSGPDLMEIMEIIGKNETIARIEFAINHLNDRIKVS